MTDFEAPRLQKSRSGIWHQTQTRYCYMVQTGKIPEINASMDTNSFQ